MKYIILSLLLPMSISAAEQDYKLIKDELYFKLAELVNNNEIYIDCYVTNELKETIISELQAVKRLSDVGEKLRIEPKSKVKELIGHSPDISDALAYRMLFKITRQK